MKIYRHGEKQTYRPSVVINGRQIAVSRSVMEKLLKRKLKSTEIVHHKNGNPCNNKITNLQVVSRAEHKLIHGKIGERTRFKQKYRFNKKTILSLYNVYKSSLKVATIIGCSEITIRRFINNITGESLSIYADKHGWAYRPWRNR